MGTAKGRAVKFSICIPNYNYAHYIGLTIASVLAQEHADFEIMVADNCSTDASVAVAEGFGDPRISVSVNRWNVGFAGNLDRACRAATGDRMILLGSDDLMQPDALATYARLAEALGDAAERTIFNSAVHVIDGEGAITGRLGLDLKLWKGCTRDAGLSAVAGCDVWRIDAATLLANTMRMMRVPFNFAATCYPRALYEAVEGYGGARAYSPDKAFAWKLLSQAESAILVDRPLFSYRYHAANQDAQQAKAGALKHIADQYAYTYDTAPEILARSGLTRDDLAAAFVEQDIGLRGLALLAKGRRGEAARGVAFGRAAYPALVRRNRKVWALRALLALGPAGALIARRSYARALQRWSAEAARI